MVTLRSILDRISEARARNYKEEYARYHSRPEQVARRAGRNKARRAAVKSGRASKGDGKDVDHKNRNPLDNRPSNLRVQSPSVNRGRNK